MLDIAPLPHREALYRRVADARTEQGRTLLREWSPAFHASRIRAPLLLSYGARDPNTSRGDSDRLAQGARLRGALTYVVFPDEGRELVRLPNRLSYLAILEHFLGDCLGGRVEPVGAVFEGAAMNVYDGAVNVPGLSAFTRGPTPAPQPSREVIDGAGGPEAAAAPDAGAAEEDAAN
jgi:hypothetical protein